MALTQQNEETKWNFEVLIIGGGVIGSAIAYYLSRDGRDVLQLEGFNQASGASGDAAGMIAAQLEHFPSELLRKWAFRSQQLMGPLIEELKLHSTVDVAMNRSGFVVPLMEEGYFSTKRASTTDLTSKQHWWDRGKLQNEIPFITNKAQGALFYPQEQQLLPAQLTASYIKGAAGNGAVFMDKCAVSKLLIENDRITGVETNKGTFTAGKVVVAAGLGSSSILRSLGIELCTYPVKGEIVALTMPREPLRYTIYTHDIYIVPKPGNEIWVGATSIPHDWDKKVSITGMNSLLHKAAEWIPEIGEASFLRTWAGLRPQTIDGLPYIGAYPGLRGLYLALGHYRNGILLSAVTGETISRLLSGESEEETGISTFSASRLLKERSVIH
ncbi:glycine oxidase ThiO [Paenibacillus sp. Marseille-Q4541]|uniref:glycine oxidase ThiO n=1 Tax=Paenibacillus sp. Marseille-Q4541 TaxID=2831522 RepID=UPI001BA662C6|nr:glycine oxidase ThiO [Paenibacillus sp. Marseille-Q4541]